MNTQLITLDNEELESWWLRVPGARRFLQTMVTEAEQNKALIADIADIDLEGFISMFTDFIQQRNSSIVIERFDVDEFVEVDDFVTDFAIKFDPNYVPDLMSNSMIVDVAKKNVLSGYIVFVKINIDVNELANIVNDFNKVDSKDKGTLIFLTSDNTMPSQITMKLSDYILPYDVQFFAFNLLENSRLPQYEKLFTATLTAKLAGTSAIIAKNLAEPELFFNGKTFAKKILADEFIKYKFENALWETQIQFALPLIETIREQLIKKNLMALQALLPVADEFGKFLEDPFDMELRHLHFYGGSVKLFSQSDWELLELVYRARNDLSHLDTIDVERLEKVFALV